MRETQLERPTLEGTMKEVNQGRWTAEIEGDFVVFLIGARVNKPWQLVRILRDLGGRRGMNHMLKYLTEHPGKGPARLRDDGHCQRPILALVRAPRSLREEQRRPAFVRVAQLLEGVGKDDRAGIWHETFLVRDGEYEAVYGNVPARGLGKASTLVPVAESSTARKRIRSATAQP